jgi:hypothetical protein
MNLRKVINKQIRRSGKGVDFVGDVNAVIAANTGRRGTTSHVSSKQSTRVVQRGGRTEVFHDESETRSGTGSGVDWKSDSRKEGSDG